MPTRAGLSALAAAFAVIPGPHRLVRRRVLHLGGALEPDLDRAQDVPDPDQAHSRSVGGRLRNQMTRHKAGDPVGLGLESQVRHVLEPARDERLPKLRLFRDPQDRLNE